jgi:hypothetical protein
MGLIARNPLLATLLQLSLAIALPSAPRPPLPPRGAAAWVYDVTGGEPAEWADAIAAFNLAPGKRAHNISTIFSYGGDMELYPALPEPYQTYFPAENQAAASAYAAVPGVAHVVLVVDGRMDGGQDYSPDLSKLTPLQLREWAAVTAALYCSFEQVDGIQLDLEPFRPPYAAPFLVFLAALAADLRSPERNCVSPLHPLGRSVSTFMFGGSATADVWAALGANGYLSVSGYDLSDAPAGTPSAPAAFAAALAASLAEVAASAAANNGSFVVGFPAAASAHEFETYTFANGTVVRGADSQLEYATAAVGALARLSGAPGYLGPALWGFSPEMEYPPHTDNVFEPGTPFVAAGEEAFLADSL